MRVTNETIEKINVFTGVRYTVEGCRNILKSLLFDLEAFNTFGEEGMLFIDYEDKHTEYSPECTDPCPDYYGCFTLRWEDEPSETVGDYMTLTELDSALFILTDYIEHKLNNEEHEED